MKKNRLLVISLIFAAALSQLNAITVDEIIEEAKKKSPSYQNVVLTYQNGLMTVESLEEKDKVGVALSATVDPLADVYEETGSASLLTLKSDKGISVSPSLTVTLPDDGNTTFSGSTSLTTRYKDGSTSVSGSLGVSHTFDFTGYNDDNADNLSYTSTKYSTELTYRKSEITFKKSVLNTIYSILNLSSSIKKAEWNEEKQQKALDKIKTLGTYDSSSSAYISAENLLCSYRQSLSALEKEYDNLLSSYRTLTGLEWDGIEVGDAPSLELTTYDNGNTSVLIESLTAESKEELYRKTYASAHPSALSTSMKLNAASSNYYKVSGALSYSGNNWNVSVSPALSISDGTTTPSVTITGTWRNKSGVSVLSEDDEEGSYYSAMAGSADSERAVNTALNNAKIAANSYLEALSSYNESATQYSLQILEWNNKKAQKKAEMEYQEKLLENSETLYSLGLATSDELREARIDYETAQTEWEKLVIEGLILQCDLDIFAL